MEKSSSQALSHMTPRVLKYREANLYTFVRGARGKLELRKLDHFQMCARLQFTTIDLLTWLAGTLSIDGATL